MKNTNLPNPRVAKILLDALRAGVVPRTGAEYIMIGRKDELSSLVYAVETVQDGGAAMRFVVGNYGAGKSFFYKSSVIMQWIKDL